MVVKTPSLKRLNYFTGQLLDQEDFEAEQTYHLESRRRHFRELHQWGIAGLDVTRQGPRQLQVSAGMAIDRYGREIVVHAPVTLTLSDAAPKSVMYVTIEYEEAPDVPPDSSEHGADSARTVEFAVVRIANVPPAPDGPVLHLARLPLDAKGNIDAVDPAMRQLMGARLAAGSVGTVELASAAVTREKLHPTVRGGWVRMPFRPSPFEKWPAFIIGATRTYCDEKGAKGTVAIPVPPGSELLKQVVVTGPRNDGGIEVTIYRCGWDAATNAPEAKPSDPLIIAHAAGPFTGAVQLNWPLNAQNHAVALYLYAQARAEVSLVAAEFD